MLVAGGMGLRSTISAFLKSWVTHVVALVIVSQVIAILYENPLRFEDDSSLPKYFFSATFQGLAAILGLSFIGFIFVYERQEADVKQVHERLHNDTLRMYDLGTGIPPMNFYDDERLLSNLTAIATSYGNSLKVVMAHSESIKPSAEIGPPPGDVKTAVKNLQRYDKVMGQVMIDLRWLHSARIAQKRSFLFFGSAISPALVPLCGSIVLLTLSDGFSEESIAMTAGILSVLFLSVYAIVRLVRSVVMWVRDLYRSGEISYIEWPEVMKLKDDMEKYKSLDLSALSEPPTS